MLWWLLSPRTLPKLTSTAANGSNPVRIRQSDKQMTTEKQPLGTQGQNAIILRYADRTVEAQSGQRLLDAILGSDIGHRHICGGHGFCTSCRVEVLEGGEHLSPVSALERERLGRDAGRLRLACQTRVYGPVHVRVPRPKSSRFSPDGDGID